MPVVLLPFGPSALDQYTRALSTDEPCASGAVFLVERNTVVLSWCKSKNLCIKKNMAMQADCAPVHSAPMADLL